MQKLNLTGQVPATPHGVLAKLWRNTVNELGIIPQMDYLIGRYVTRSIAMDSKNVRRKTKSTLTGNITADEITWKVFTNLMFDFVRAVRIDITIKTTFANGDTHYSTIGMTSVDSKDNTENVTPDSKGPEKEPESATKKEPLHGHH